MLIPTLKTESTIPLFHVLPNGKNHSAGLKSKSEPLGQDSQLHACCPDYRIYISKYTYCQNNENLKSFCRIDYYDSFCTIIRTIAMVASKVGKR